MQESDLISKAFVIGARETVRGFQLIGVAGKEVSEPSDILETLDDALQKDYALIIISASTAYKVEDQLEEIRLETHTPIFVVSDVNLKVDTKDLEKKFRKFIGIH
ncbi:MAG: V-type ATP synthase subunit F [Candidatus Heimdallarchaeaceae archaeon]